MYLLILGFTFFSCKKEEVEVPKDSAVYDIVVQGMWAAASHPVNYPDNAHFSPIVGMTHNDKAALFTIGTNASTGIKNMAETGKTTELDAEIDNMISSGNVSSRVNGTGISSGTGGGVASLRVTGNHGLVSIVSMVAPSPDWYIGVQNISLIRNGEYITDTIISMESFDAGTDSGTDFKSENKPTDPAGPISVITDSPLGNGTEVRPALATIRFTLRR